MEIPSTQVLDDFLPGDSPQSSPEKKKQVGTLRIHGSSYPIFTGENRIGRDPKMCSIVLEGKALSAEHAIIEAHAIDGVFICDLESTNKTRLGKIILKPQIRYQLQDNAQVYFADILATYHQLAKHNSSVESMDSSKEGDFFIPETPSDNTFKKPGDRLCVLESPSDDSIIESSQPVKDERSQLRSTSSEPSNGVRKHIIFGEVKDETALESICEAATQLEFEEGKLESCTTPMKSVTADICEAPTQCFEADFAGKLEEEAQKSEIEAATQFEFEEVKVESCATPIKFETADICDAPTQCFGSAGKLKEKEVAVKEDNIGAYAPVVAEGSKKTLTEEKSDSDTDPEEVFGGHDEKKNGSDADDSMTDIFDAPTQLVDGEYGYKNKKEEQPSYEMVNSISKASLPQNTNEQFKNSEFDISLSENNVVKPKVPESSEEFDEGDDLFDAPTQKINHTKDSESQEEDDGKEKTVASTTDEESTLNYDLSQAPTQIISNETLQFDFVKPESRKHKEAENVTEISLNANVDQNGKLPVVMTELGHSLARSGKNDVKVIEPDTKKVKENSDNDPFEAPTQLINEGCLIRENEISPLEKDIDRKTLKDDETSTKPDYDKGKIETCFSDRSDSAEKPLDPRNEEMKASAEPDGVSDLFDAPTQVIGDSCLLEKKQISPLEKIDRKTSDEATCAKPNFNDRTVADVYICDKNAPKQKPAKSVDSMNEEMKAPAEPDTESDLFDAPIQLIGDSRLLGGKQISPSEKTENVDSDRKTLRDDAIFSKPDFKMNDKSITEVSFGDNNAPNQEENFEFAKPVNSMSEETKVERDGDSDLYDAPTQILHSERQHDFVASNSETAGNISTSTVRNEVGDSQIQILPSGLGLSKAKGDSSSENTNTSVNVDCGEGATDILDVQTQILPSGLGLNEAKGDSSSENTSTSVNVDGGEGATGILDEQTQIFPSGLGLSKAKGDSSSENTSTSVNVDGGEGATGILDEQTQILPSGLGLSKAKGDSSSENTSTSVNVDGGVGATDILDVQTQMLPSDSKAIGNGSSEKKEETTKSVGGKVNNSEDIEATQVFPSKAKETEAPKQLMKTTESIRGEIVEDDLCNVPSQIIERDEIETSKVSSVIPAEPDGKEDSDKLLRKGREAEKSIENAECELKNEGDDKPATGSSKGDDVEITSRMKSDLHSTDICIDIFHEQKEVPPPLKKSRARVYTNRAKQRTDDEEMDGILEAREQSEEEAESGDDTGDTRVEEVTSSPVLKQNHVRKRSVNVPSLPEIEPELQEGIASPVIQKQSHLKRKGPATYSNRNKRLKVESDSTPPEISSLLDSERTKPARTESRIPVLTHPSPEGRRKKKETEASPQSTPRKTRDKKTYSSRSKNVEEDCNSSKQSVKKSKGGVTKRSPNVKDRECSEEENKLVKGVEVKRGEQKPVARMRGVSLKKDENKSKEDTTKLNSRRSSRRNQIKMDEPKSKEEPLDTVKQKSRDLSSSKSRLKAENKQSSGQASNMKDIETDSHTSPRKSRLKLESRTSSRQASNSDTSPRKSWLKVESKTSSRRASNMKDNASDSDMSPRKSGLKEESKTSSRQASSMKNSASDSDMSPRKSGLKVESKTSSRQALSMKDSAPHSDDMSPRKSRLKVESKTSSRRASNMKDSASDIAQQSSMRASSMKDSAQQLPRTTRKRASAPPAEQEPENKYEDLSDSAMSHSAARRTSNRRAKHVEEVNTDFVYTSTSRNNSPSLSKKHKQDDTESESSQSEPKASRSQSKTTPQKEASTTPRPASSRSNKRKLSESEVVASPKRVKGSSRLNESVTSGVEGSPTRARGRGNNTYKVLFTGVTCTKDDEEFVKKLGGCVVDTPDTCTVLVTDKVRRTYKFLCIMGMGKPVVSLEWLKRSCQSGSFLDPWQFIVKDVESEKKFNFSLHDSLKVASQHQLLTGYSVMVTSSVKPPPQEMKGIITSSGGKILTRSPGNNWPEKSFTISCPDDKSQWNKVKKGGKPIVGAEVLLLGVLQQKLDLKTHALVV